MKKDPFETLDEDGNYPEPKDYSKDNKKQTINNPNQTKLDKFNTKKSKSSPRQTTLDEKFGM